MDRADTGDRLLAASAGPWWRRYVLTGRSPSAYVAAACIIVAAFGMRAALDFVAPGLPRFMLLFPALVFIGLFCGTAAGAMAAVLCATMADFFWVPPRFSLGPLSADALYRLGVFLSASALVLWMTHTLRRALLEAESVRNMLDVALAHGNAGAWEVDAAAQQVRASASTHALFGIPYDGQPHPLEEWLAKLAPEEAEPVRCALGAAVAGAGSFHAEFRLQQNDGSIRWIESRGGALPAGPPARVLGAVIDVTHRVLAEQALQEKDARLQASEARYRALAGAIPGILFVANAAGRNTYVNNYFEEFAGLPADELLGNGWLKLVHEADRARIRELWLQAVAVGQLYEAEFRLRGANGNDRWFLCRGHPLRDAESRLVAWFGVAMDIEDRKRAERAQADSERQLKQALEERELLMREADHRIKNSLQLVVSLLHLQRRRLADPEAAEAVGSAISRVEAIAQSHVALQQSKDLKTVDFGAALRDLCTNLGQLNPAITVRCGFEESLALDAERAIPLALVVSELMTNALRHAYPTGGGVVTADALMSGDMLMVTISDHGAGHGAELRDKGLGWSVVRSLSRKIGAELEVRSAPGDGTTCTLRLRGCGDATVRTPDDGQQQEAAVRPGLCPGPAGA